MTRGCELRKVRASEGAKDSERVGLASDFQEGKGINEATSDRKTCGVDSCSRCGRSRLTDYDY